VRSDRCFSRPRAGESSFSDHPRPLDPPRRASDDIRASARRGGARSTVSAHPRKRRPAIAGFAMDRVRDAGRAEDCWSRPKVGSPPSTDRPRLPPRHMRVENRLDGGFTMAAANTRSTPATHNYRVIFARTLVRGHGRFPRSLRRWAMVSLHLGLVVDSAICWRNGTCARADHEPTAVRLLRSDHPRRMQSPRSPPMTHAWILAVGQSLLPAMNSASPPGTLTTSSGVAGLKGLAIQRHVSSLVKAMTRHREFDATMPYGC